MINDNKKYIWGTSGNEVKQGTGDNWVPITL